MSPGAADAVAAVGREVGLVVDGTDPAPRCWRVFFFYPVGSIVGRGLIGPDGFDWQAFADVLGRPRFLRILWFTVWQAAASAALALVLGIPVAYLLYRGRSRGRRGVRALVTVPFVLPTVVVGLAFRTLFAADRAAGLPGGGTARSGPILAAQCSSTTRWWCARSGQPGRTWTAGPRRRPASLGAGPVRAFLTITLPSLGRRSPRPSSWCSCSAPPVSASC